MLRDACRHLLRDDALHDIIRQRYAAASAVAAKIRAMRRHAPYFDAF